MRRIFEEIYRRNAWGGDESVSGPGSSRSRGADFAAELIALVQRLGIRSVLDAPCGDFNWMQDVAGAFEIYTGIDIVPELVDANQSRFESPDRTFVCGDLTRDPLPRADLILCRDGLVHFSFADIHAALDNFRRSGSRWLLATTFIDVPANEDIATGEWRVLNLEKAPFYFPTPLALVDEKCPHTGGTDKRLGLWEL